VIEPKSPCASPPGPAAKLQRRGRSCCGAVPERDRPETIDRDERAVAEAFAAWSLVRLLGSLPITPGGLGVVEVGLTAALVGFGGANAEVVAAVLLYRFLTIVPTLILGLLAGAIWRRLKAVRA